MTIHKKYNESVLKHNIIFFGPDIFLNEFRALRNFKMPFKHTFKQQIEL